MSQQQYPLTDDLSDEELAAVYDTVDNFVLLGKSTKHKKLHLDCGPDNPLPICGGGYNESKLVRKDTAAYPPGYFDICLWCVSEWREWGGSDD